MKAGIELGKWYAKQKNKGSKEEDLNLYDIVLMNKETKRVESVLVWRGVQACRVDNLIMRERIGYGIDENSTEDIVTVISGKAFIGSILP